MVISFNDGKSLTCTPEHLLLIKNPENNDPTIIWDNGNAYKQAKDLTEKDILYLRLSILEDLRKII